jgi:hypothetical protein
MTWKIEPGTLNPKDVERRIRTTAELRDFCLSLAKAKLTGEVRPLNSRKISREEQDAIWAELQRETTLAAKSQS